MKKLGKFIKTILTYFVDLIVWIITFAWNIVATFFKKILKVLKL